jgi:hypothetical protein
MGQARGLDGDAAARRPEVGIETGNSSARPTTTAADP